MASEDSNTEGLEQSDISALPMMQKITKEIGLGGRNTPVIEFYFMCTIGLSCL